MSITKHLIICMLGVCLGLADVARAADSVIAGPLYSRFPLTLEPGQRTEIISPFFYSQETPDEHTWALPPFMAHYENRATDSEILEIAYPALTRLRFGSEHRWQFFQLLSTAGGTIPDEGNSRRFTLFPIYFQQRSTEPTNNYTAVVPIYGHLKHRLFRDEIDFVLFPCYSKTRKKDVVTYNMPYPFFHLRHGNNLHGWQVWPFVGHEHKDPTKETNILNEVVVKGGYDSGFLFWPIAFGSTNGIGTTNITSVNALLPMRVETRSNLRESTNWGWPIGVTHTVDREKKFEEWDLPWPIVEIANGENRRVRRYFPFYSRGHTDTLVDIFYAWPVYKYSSIHSPPLERERTRILFFLYSDSMTKSTTDPERMTRRTSLFPFYTRHRDPNGNTSLQVLAILEPFFPGNDSIEREYSQVYAFWRAQKNPKSGAASQSLLWNLYRRETEPQSKKISLLFGLFQYQSSPAGRRWRVCYIPMGKSSAPAPGAASRH